MNPTKQAPQKLKKSRWKVSPGPDVRERFTKIAERLDIPVATLASIALSELSYVRPESFFAALGSIPGDLKTRPVGRPAGAARKEEKTPHSSQHLAAS